METSATQQKKTLDQLTAEMDQLKKRIKDLEGALDVYTLAPRILDVMIESRGDRTPYVDATYTLKCDVVLRLDWQGRRYNIPAFEL